VTCVRSIPPTILKLPQSSARLTPTMRRMSAGGQSGVMVASVLQYFAVVGISALALFLTSKAIIASYFARKEAYTDHLVEKLKGADSANKG